MSETFIKSPLPALQLINLVRFPDGLDLHVLCIRPLDLPDYCEKKEPHQTLGE